MGINPQNPLNNFGVFEGEKLTVIVILGGEDADGPTGGIDGLQASIDAGHQGTLHRRQRHHVLFSIQQQRPGHSHRNLHIPHRILTSLSQYRLIVKPIQRGCAKLKRFALYLRAGGLTDLGLSYVGQYSQNVRWMLLGYAGESDAGLLEFSKGCPSLQKLEMQHF
ncbi:hypothetical protein L3X38_030809 [Prunus dulcis]|uniref:RNI-like superfamily protein n=1 Tax=Prunus dulcis TaxID=3755 RepID=A0AAD4VBC5_PRUDU|nr:hypothetical protein L3X38_030809 [Prunus dulcis]